MLPANPYLLPEVRHKAVLGGKHYSNYAKKKKKRKKQNK